MNRKCFRAALVLAVSLGIVQSQATEIRFSEGTDGTILYSESHALLIANGTYKSNAWPNLPSVYDEAKELAVGLQAQGFSLYGDKVHTDLTGNAIETLVKAFIDEHGVGKQESGQNRLLIYFAGHGETLNKRGYIVPIDAPSKAREKQFMARAIDMDLVGTWARRADAKHVLFAFDSCFAGTIFKTRAGNKVPEGIQLRTGKPVRQFITAGGADETVPEQSAFTPYFMRGIAGEADMNKDGYVTATEVAEMLRDKVAASNGNHVQFGALPNPDFDQGDMVFVPVKTAVVPVKAAVVPIENRYVFSEKAPDDLVESLEQAKSDGQSVYSVSSWAQGTASSGMRWVVSASRRSYHSDVPPRMIAKMREWDRDSSRSAYRALLGDKGEWLLVHGGSYSVSSTIASLKTKLREVTDGGDKFAYAAFSNDGYCLIKESGGAIYVGVPESFDTALSTLLEEGKQVKIVSFGPAGTWAIVHGKNGYTGRAPTSLKEIIQKLRDASRRIEAMELLPNGGWVVVAAK